MIILDLVLNSLNRAVCVSLVVSVHARLRRERYLVQVTIKVDFTFVRLFLQQQQLILANFSELRKIASLHVSMYMLKIVASRKMLSKQKAGMGALECPFDPPQTHTKGN